jgi:hypothetical protein
VAVSVCALGKVNHRQRKIGISGDSPESGIQKNIIREINSEVVKLLAGRYPSTKPNILSVRLSCTRALQPGLRQQSLTDGILGSGNTYEGRRGRWITNIIPSCRECGTAVFWEIVSEYVYCWRTGGVGKWREK